MNAGLPYDVLLRAVPIHPTVSELIPTMLGEMEPGTAFPRWQECAAKRAPRRGRMTGVRTRL